jgi:hypothetical protein
LIAVGEIQIAENPAMRFGGILDGFVPATKIRA